MGGIIISPIFLLIFAHWNVNQIVLFIIFIHQSEAKSLFLPTVNQNIELMPINFMRIASEII